MLHAPSRYVRFVRIVIPLAAFCGLGYLFLITFGPQRFGATKTRIIVDGQRTGQGSAVTFQDLILDEEPQVSSKLWQDINEKDYQFEDDKDKVEETLDHQISMIPSNDIQDDKGLIKTPEEEGLLNHEHQQQHDQQHRRYQQQQGQQHHRMYSKDYQHREWQESSSSSAQRNVIGIEDRGAEVILSPIVATRQKEKEELIYEVEKANGVFVILTREEDIQATRETIRQVEDRFNRDRNYPWVILSPLPLTDGSKNRIRTLSKGRMTFGTIPREHWRLPTWIEPPRVLSGDYERMKIGLERTSLDKRRQWRYQSGFLARHELLDGFEFFWRVEPGMDIFCDIEDDPMLAMKKNGHLFAWSHSELIREAGVPGAWSLIQRFKETHGDLIPKSNDEAFLKREGEDAYTACTYGVQNSIARVDFMRSPEYIAYFDFIDREGPIYYEKWNDAIVITIGLSLLARRNDTLHLVQLGWAHGMQSYCPNTPEVNKFCHCDPHPVASAFHMNCTAFWRGLSPSPRRKERVECNQEGKCIVYISKLT